MLREPRGGRGDGGQEASGMMVDREQNTLPLPAIQHATAQTRRARLPDVIDHSLTALADHLSVVRRPDVIIFIIIIIHRLHHFTQSIISYVLSTSFILVNPAYTALRHPFSHHVPCAAYIWMCHYDTRKHRHPNVHTYINGTTEERSTRSYY